ncbi:MAG: hypothetical protein ABEK59_07480, partial [Halobacteria archaeon]
MSSAQRYAQEHQISQAKFDELYRRELEANLEAFSRVSDKPRALQRLEKRLRLGKKQRRSVQQGRQYQNTVASETFDFSGTHLYRVAPKEDSGFVKRVAQAGAEAVSDIPGAVKRGAGTFFEQLSDQEKAEVRAWLDRTYSKEGRRAYGEIVKTSFERVTNEYSKRYRRASAYKTRKLFNNIPLISSLFGDTGDVVSRFETSDPKETTTRVKSIQGEDIVHSFGYYSKAKNATDLELAQLNQEASSKAKALYERLETKFREIDKLYGSDSVKELKKIYREELGDIEAGKVSVSEEQFFQRVSSFTKRVSETAEARDYKDLSDQFVEEFFNNLGRRVKGSEK